MTELQALRAHLAASTVDLYVLSELVVSQLSDCLLQKQLAIFEQLLVDFLASLLP
jgi:hypothetical protein